MEHPRQASPSTETSDTLPASDELADKVAEDLALTPAASQELVAVAPDQVILEEEKVKDEIEIQIDLLSDPDWVVRREAVITLGEMGDERCVEPLSRALRDGDWQVREVAIEALGQVGSPAVEILLRLLRDWDVRKYAILALGKIRDERVLDPLMVQLRNDEFKDDAINALVELGEPAVPKFIAALKDRGRECPTERRIGIGPDQTQRVDRSAHRHVAG